jgi:uncharacterized protein YggE
MSQSATVTPAAPPAPVPETTRRITVVGEGLVSQVPDVACINVSAEVRADTVSEAKAEVDRQIAAITAVLDELGIEAKDIRTNHYSIRYEREQMTVMRDDLPGSSQEGYRVSNMLRVAVRDVERARDLLDAVVEAGANQVWGVTFTVFDESAWQGQTRAEAMADARARAGELAELAGLELGEVLSVSEIIGGMGYRPITVVRVRHGRRRWVCARGARNGHPGAGHFCRQVAPNCDRARSPGRPPGVLLGL